MSEERLVEGTNSNDAGITEFDSAYDLTDQTCRSELKALTESVKSAMQGRRVLEVACGTGYWTKVAAEVASHVVALDVSPKTLAVAQSRALPPESVEFCVHDAYELASVQGTYNAGLANFWLSHVPKGRLEQFFDGFHRRLGNGSTVFMADRMYGSRLDGTLVVKRGVEDTFRMRRMPDGRVADIIENYYDEHTLRSMLEPYAEDLVISGGVCYWWLQYTVKNIK